MNKSNVLLFSTKNSENINDKIQEFVTYFNIDIFDIHDFDIIQNIAKYNLIIIHSSNYNVNYSDYIMLIKQKHPDISIWILLDNFKEQFEEYILLDQVDLVLEFSKLNKFISIFDNVIPQNSESDQIYEPKIEELQNDLLENYENRIELLENDKQKLELTVLDLLKTENELLNSNRFQSRILENIPALVYIKDSENFKYLYANKAVQDLVGLSNEALIGKNATDIFPDYYAEFLNRTDKEAIANDGKPCIFEEYVKLNSGTEHVLITKKQLIKSNDGSSSNILCVSEVITDLKSSDKKLKKSIQRFSKIFHINNVPILLFEFNSLLITDVNTSFCELSGYSRQELIGLRFDKLQFFMDTDFKKDIIKQISIGDEIENLEVKIKSKNGNVKFILASFGRLELDATETVIFTSLDISLRIEAEKEIREAYQQQKQLAMMRSQFISMISHEFRTPLTTIMLSNDLLKRYGDLWDINERNKHFQRIQDTILKMTQLMENVLIIGKMDSGQFVLNTEPVEIDTFCRSLTSNIEFNTGGKYKIELKVNVSLSIYHIDENLLALILSNLLTNAVKYSFPKTNIIFDLSETENNLIFKIIDFGIGIAETELKDLFNSFYRGSNVGSISGYGLGLSIVKKCIDTYNGEISVKSDVGEGTEFTVIIPKFDHKSF